MSTVMGSSSPTGTRLWPCCTLTSDPHRKPQGQQHGAGLGGRQLPTEQSHSRPVPVREAGAAAAPAMTFPWSYWGVGGKAPEHRGWGLGKPAPPKLYRKEGPLGLPGPHMPPTLGQRLLQGLGVLAGAGVQSLGDAFFHPSRSPSRVWLPAHAPSAHRLLSAQGSLTRKFR